MKEIWKEISWEEVYDFISKKLNELKNYGPQSVAFAAKSESEQFFLNQFAYAYGLIMAALAHQIILLH